MPAPRYGRAQVIAALLGSLTAAITASIRSALAASNPNPVLVAPNPNYNPAAANETLVRNFIDSAWNGQSINWGDITMRKAGGEQVAAPAGAPLAAGHPGYMSVLAARAGNDCGAGDKFVKTEDFQSFVQSYRKAFPNLHVTIQSMQSTATGVTVRWQANGTYAGGLTDGGRALNGMGRAVSITGNSFFRISGGKIESMGMSYNSSALEHQISVPVVQMPAGAGISH